MLVVKRCRKLPFDIGRRLHRKLSQLERADVIALHTNLICETARRHLICELMTRSMFTSLFPTRSEHVVHDTVFQCQYMFGSFPNRSRHVFALRLERE